VIESKGIKKLGMIRFESGFSKSIQNTLQSIMDSHQNSLVTETYTAIGSSDFRTNILKLKDRPLDAVFLDMLDFDVIKYLKDSKNLGFKKQIIGYTTLRDVLNKKGEDLSDLEGALMLDWEVPSAEFTKVFSTKYGVNPRRGANKSYDTVYMLAEAISKSKDAAGVSTYIENNSFKTINGEFKFDSKHAVFNTPVKVFEVREGKLVEVKSSH
jgi:ABC-type branched-subunit amino acid transport system substrate-binding protein